MKIIVQVKPDPVGLILNGLEKDDFIIDQDTYCYFRDKTFLKDMEKFIKKMAPRKWQETANLQGAKEVEKCYENQEFVNKYYSKYNKHR